MAETTLSNHFSIGLWKTLSTSQMQPSPNCPILAFASSFVPYFALVTLDKGGAIRRTLFSKHGRSEKVVDHYDMGEGCSLPQKLVGHTLPLIVDGLSCPNLIDLEGYFGVAMTHIFFDQMLPLFPDSMKMVEWFQNDWFTKKGETHRQDLIEEFDYQKATLESLGMEILQKKKKRGDSFSSSLDALRATKQYLAFRSQGAIRDEELVWNSLSHLPLTEAVRLGDYLSRSEVQEAQIRNLKRAFNSGESSYASMLSQRIHAMMRTSPIATKTNPRYEYNTLAFDLSKTSYNSFVAWEIKRNSNLMLLT